MATERAPARPPDGPVWLAAVVGPFVLTFALLPLSFQQTRDYVFLYLGLVAVLGVLRGFWPAITAAVLSFLLVDYFFVPPVYTFTIADEQDIVNLLAFVAVAAVVGLLANRRRQLLLESQALARQLREANTELVRLNKEQAEAAQAALRLARSEQQVKSLQEADRVRRELLANVSHELRTPLGTILAESTSGSSQADQRMAVIAGEARRLEALVKDMLDMARIEGGALELDLEPLGLDDAVRAAIERLQRMSPKREVAWDSEASRIEVLADWDRLGQVLDNLLANADRFAPPGTELEVTATQSEELGLATVRVIDHGPGVDPALRDRLFERFVRSDAESSSGTGLGLAIVRGLVEAHAGSVALENANSGSGAVFRFTLPLAP